MTMTGDIGRLLITIDNAVTTVWQDDACITHLIPSPTYDDDGVLLDVTISIFKNKYNKDDYKYLMEIFDNLVYNPVFHSEHTLSKVNITFKEL